MSHDLQLTAIARSIAKRLPELSLESAHLVDTFIATLEHIANAGEWERRVATGPGDVDASWHLVRHLRATVATSCGGSWAITDEVEQHDSPPVAERCETCWRAAAASSPGGPALGEAILVLVAETAERDRESAARQERTRDEMFEPAPAEPGTAFRTRILTTGNELLAGARARADRERGPTVRIGLPGDDLSDRVVVDEFELDKLTTIGGPEPYDSLELEWDEEWEDRHAGSGS